MSDGRTRLEFEATIAGVSVKSPKEDPYSHALSGGGLELKLLVQLPEGPKPPAIGWKWADGHASSQQWKPRPSDLPRKKNETDEAYAARADVVALAKEQADYDASRARWDEEMVVYRAASARHAQRLMSYAQITGIASVLGNQRLLISVEPYNQDLLPGFTTSLLAPVGEDGGDA